jgi:hypothetical protein
MKATPADIQKYLTALEKTTGRITSIAKQIDVILLHEKPDKNEWSANDILAHLRSCADVWGGQIDKMIEKDKQKLPYAHPRQWIKKTNYRELPFHTSFQAFKAQRRKLLKILKGLSLEDWSRRATIKGREHTIFTHVRRMAKHEDVHCHQIKEILD